MQQNNPYFDAEREEDRVSRMVETIVEGSEPPVDGDPAGELSAFAFWLSAATPTPRPEFEDQLADQLVSRLRERQRARQAPQPARLRETPPSLPWLAQPSGRIAAVICLVLLASFSLTWTVYGDTLLRLLTPREVSHSPPVPTPVAPISSRSGASQEQADAAGGFTPILPGYLPDGCSLQQQFVNTARKTADLKYSCLRVLEQPGNIEDGPVVNVGRAQSITLDGQPAIFIDGGWVQVNSADGERTSLRWEPGWIKQVLFDHQGLLIRLESHSLGEAELIKIAKSMREGR